MQTADSPTNYRVNIRTVNGFDEVFHRSARNATIRFSLRNHNVGFMLLAMGCSSP